MAVFSAGPMLLASKDEGRAILYSLDDGQVKAHLNGFLPAASAESQLLSLIENNRLVDPWYRYNTVVFANPSGARRLSRLAQSCRIDDLATLDKAGNLSWKVRCALLRPWPAGLVTLLSRLRYTLFLMSINARTGGLVWRRSPRHSGSFGR